MNLLRSSLTGTALALVPAAAAALQHAPDSQRGYVWMFILMASTPYILLVVIGGGIFRARRRAREQEVERVLREQRAWEVQHPGGEG